MLDGRWGVKDDMIYLISEEPIFIMRYVGVRPVFSVQNISLPVSPICGKKSYHRDILKLINNVYGEVHASPEILEPFSEWSKENYFKVIKEGLRRIGYVS